MKSVAEFLYDMEVRGWSQFDTVLAESELLNLRREVDSSYHACRDIQVKNGVSDGTDGTLHHLVCFGGAYLEFLKQMFLDPYISAFFEGKYILNSFGGVKNMTNNISYLGNIHRDVRTYTGNFRLMINMLVMLDDFTEENGATHVLSGSQMSSVKPSAEEFYQNSHRLTGKGGSIVLFDSNLWHAAGVNRTSLERRALTLTYSRPLMKQQLDYPQVFGDILVQSFSEDLKQILGYNARIAKSLDEWYVPPARRPYRSDQG